MRFDSRRANVPGYLEFIESNGQTVGLIVEMNDGSFHGMHGLKTVVATTVASVKEQLFPLIEQSLHAHV
jgi:hypothetical protein